MHIITFLVIDYQDRLGGGTIYPDTGEVIVLDRAERRPRLALALDCDEEAARQVLEANGRFHAAMDTAEGSTLLWAATRERRDKAIADVEWMISRHLQERDLVAAKKKSTSTLTEAQYLVLLQYIQALRDIPNAAEYPRQVVWPERPEGL